ncbi:alpha-N-acetylneuraminide alpha-2,8-sialyltransferase-like isoform X2 [Anneissia japonica]|nr:alpha-N-acetylneuraminide alpha-2,8-sialyltransferase-like isoform X2 [Anneissia japonica]XP_033109840.1 alpha-N-acetylneuraminide alpha-2,8-sialyltransferase-like isoform X2 [Anneissia japonica]XP_033109841.1 alpha-N-acetylneuraminide alpha-2,8-sialyltransferase-like isoform X2 [Anneissia japonica]XP_033109842.1 alpha-N-acetylneuraminide alpha-2,8-sialyltransferase-like isoform X2 [Anneissia japonica]XP_033109843.1 alpha-N-acetylneuraminide alpha-2,8-sialyltransferase-like isoform X2 [Annei
MIMRMRTRLMKLIGLLLIGTLTITSYVFRTMTPTNNPLHRIDFIVQHYTTRTRVDTPQSENEILAVKVSEFRNVLDVRNTETEYNNSFLMSQDNNEQIFNIGKLGKLLQKPWTQNKTNINALFTRTRIDTPQSENEFTSVKVPEFRNVLEVRNTETEYNNSFLMSQDNEKIFNLGKLGKLLQKPWTQNKTNINALFTDDLAMVLDSRYQFATKNNTQRQQVVKFTHSKNLAINVPHDVYRALPEAYPFGEKKIKNCSVVGSGGILKNSSCGSQIDSSEFVIRFNIPPLQDFIKDAGRISNITTINPSQIEFQFNSLRTKVDRERFIAYIKQYGKYIWISGFGLPLGLYLTRRALRTIRSTPGIKIKVLLGHPKQWTAMNKFWSHRGVKAERISSGAYWLSSALTMCHEVHLYGFWPFRTDQHGNLINYHYYEDKAPNNKILMYHHFDEEFKAIVDLHIKGIVKLHVGKCQC